MKVKEFGIVGCVFMVSVFFATCNNVNSDQFTSGSYRFVFDESLSPILDQELYVFKSSYPDAKPEVLYQPENKILDFILNNKARFAVMGRTLRPDEIKLLTNKSLPPIIDKIAEDAIALIVGKNNPDSLMLLTEVKNVFINDTKTGKSLVFDSPNSSVINYLKEFAGTNELRNNIYALKNSKEVIKYVASHPNAIGFISYNWLLEPDADYEEAAASVKTVSIKDDSKRGLKGGYVKPSQSSLALNQYPLHRTVYVVDCTGKVGLGTGFAAFLQSENGQKIVLRAGLLPNSLPRRDINIKTN